VPETDVALNCRLVCREFRDLVDGNELQIAQLMAEREHNRLQSQIDMRRQMMPRNLTAFAFDACLWVSCAASASLIPKSQ
jgi:fatty acid desaturase